MLLRIRTSSGVKRFDVDPDWSLKDFFYGVRDELGIEKGDVFEIRTTESLKSEKSPLNEDSLHQVNFATIRTKIKDLHLNPGHLFTVHYETKQAASLFPTPAEDLVAPHDKLGATEEDEVDKQLEQCNGKIASEPTAMCRHPPTSKCIHCLPLDAWDPKLQERLKLKHLSFHSYIRQCKSEQKYADLVEMELGIKPNCKNHLPWPAGICTHCMPPPVTLKRQVYRHVDYIEFESPQIIDRFLQFWRKSGGAQRIGFLVGRYEMYPESPLGIKAVVSAIYEPPQYNEITGCQLLRDPNEKTYLWLTEQLGLKEVGYVFTDLEDDGTDSGKVMYKRHQNSYFLNSLEVLFSAERQLVYPNYTKQSKKGHFGSKYATVVISGDEQNEVGLNAYQISDQGMALVRHKILLPTKRPAAARVRSSSDEQFVPECYYSYRDEYQNDISKRADPYLPLDYLLVNLGAGSPTNPTCMFFSTALASEKCFPVENRADLGVKQTVRGFLDLLRSVGSAALSDFHVLLWLLVNPRLAIHTHLFSEVVRCVKTKDKEALEVLAASKLCTAYLDELKVKANEGDYDDGQLEDRQAPFMPPPGLGDGQVAEDLGIEEAWQCMHCTVINEEASDICFLCALPRHT